MGTKFKWPREAEGWDKDHVCCDFVTVLKLKQPIYMCPICIVLNVLGPAIWIDGFANVEYILVIFVIYTPTCQYLYTDISVTSVKFYNSELGNDMELILRLGGVKMHFELIPLRIYKVYSTASKSSIFLILSFITNGLTTLSKIVEKAKSVNKNCFWKFLQKIARKQLTTFSGADKWMIGLKLKI